MIPTKDQTDVNAKLHAICRFLDGVDGAEYQVSGTSETNKEGSSLKFEIKGDKLKILIRFGRAFRFVSVKAEDLISVQESLKFQGF